MNDTDLAALLSDLGNEVEKCVESGRSRREVWKIIVEHPGYGRRLRMALGALFKRMESRWDPEFADDLFQEVTVILTYQFRGEDAFPWKPVGEFGHWLSTVLPRTSKIAWDRLTRHRRYEVAVADKAAEVAAAKRVQEETDHVERWARIAEAVNLIDGPCRLLLHMLLFEKASQKKIAAEFERSEPWVTAKKPGCISELQAILGMAGQG